MDLIRLMATVADAFLLSTSPCVPVGSITELLVGDTILDSPKSASFKCPEASGLFIVRGDELYEKQLCANAQKTTHKPLSSPYKII